MRNTVVDPDCHDRPTHWDSDLVLGLRCRSEDKGKKVEPREKWVIVSTSTGLWGSSRT